MKNSLYYLFLFINSLYEQYRTLKWKISSYFKKITLIKIYRNTYIRLYNYGYITKRLYQQKLLVNFSKSFEYVTFDTLSRTIKDDFYILDIGANVGVHTIFMSKYLSTEGKIYSFEPSNETFSILNKNIELNNCIPKITCINSAISDRNGKCFLGVGASDNKKTNNDAFKYLQYSNLLEKKMEEIELITLDEWVEKENITKIDLIKIDVEGAELLCLNGGHKSISKYRPIIIFECYDEYMQRFNYGSIDIFKYFIDHNYRLDYLTDFQWVAYPKNY
jgi:FkbM family methyltransferase